MLPKRVSRRIYVLTLIALVAVLQLIILGTTTYAQKESLETANHILLQDNWEFKTVNSKEKASKQEKDSNYHVQEVTEPVIKAEDSNKASTIEVIEKSKTNDYSETAGLKELSNKYGVEMDYLYYIIEVEKTFNLEPCELLALIAQESGFRPKTHMDGGSYSYSTTQMKLPTAKTAYMAITEYYNMEIPYPTHERLRDDQYYAALLAGGYLRYLHDTYNEDRLESYTAYNWGIGGRMIFYNQNGHFRSSYALKLVSLHRTIQNMVEYENKDITS